MPDISVSAAGWGGNLLEQLYGASFQQGVAASVAATTGLMVNGLNRNSRGSTIITGFVLLQTALGAGESHTIDVTKNGTTILTAPLVLDNTSVAGTKIALPITASALAAGFFAFGQGLRFATTYVAGAGTGTGLLCFIEIKPL